ncbi:hypothetical protein OsJ_33146 [Oryza sativa Japonica Group]|uniref:Retrotransposon protein, putative, unclassified n=1 Tax=Oryza sativa subsp. japonica TaxID=39947 RepID=B9G9M9_ORYSJ|nr:hypothetical protein OsJ_33146 [Oryza sativa Japonica Group]
MMMAEDGVPLAESEWLRRWWRRDSGPLEHRPAALELYAKTLTCPSKSDESKGWRWADGSRTSFWHDRWLGIQQLANLFPALYSHSTSGHANVKEVLSRGILSFLVPRLSQAAQADLHNLENMLAACFLNEEPDIRQNDRSGILTSKQIYEAKFPAEFISPNWKIIWACKAPLKVGNLSPQ